MKVLRKKYELRRLSMIIFVLQVLPFSYAILVNGNSQKYDGKMSDQNSHFQRSVVKKKQPKTLKIVD